MDDKKTKRIVMITIVVIILLLLAYCTWMKGPTGGENPSDTTLQQPAALQPFFADENMVEIQTARESKVTVGGVSYPQDIFFVRFNLRAENDGLVSIKVRPSDISAFTNTGVSIEQSAIATAFSCLTDEVTVTIPATTCTTDAQCGGIGFSCNAVTGNCRYTWDTMPSTGNTGCSSKIYLPLKNFEQEGKDQILGNADDISQPIKFVATLIGEYQDPLTTLTKQIIKKPEIGITISFSPINYGSFTGEVTYSTNNYLKECITLQTDPCPGSILKGSACYGVSQTCYADTGLWPGCPISLYKTINPAFNPGYEYTGGLALCKDNIDNDCDGYADNDGAISTQSCVTSADCFTDAGQTCVSGKCVLTLDADCPPCWINMRTSASIGCTKTGPTTFTCTSDHLTTYTDTFLVFDKNGNNDFDETENYGYVSTYFTSATVCSGAGAPSSCATQVGTTIGGLRIADGGTNTINICELVSGKCQYAQFKNTALNRCKPGDAVGGYQIYPDCLSERPTGMWMNSERCVDY